MYLVAGEVEFEVALGKSGSPQTLSPSTFWIDGHVRIETLKCFHLLHRQPCAPALGLARLIAVSSASFLALLRRSSGLCRALRHTQWMLKCCQDLVDLG